MLRVMRKKVINRRKNHHLRRSRKSRKSRKTSKNPNTPKIQKNPKTPKNPKNPKNIHNHNQPKTMKILLTQTKVKVPKTSEQS